MKKIRLSRGKFAIVDDEDFDALNRFKWCALEGQRTFYAVRHVNDPSGESVCYGNGNGKRYVRKKRILLRMHREIIDAKWFDVDHKNGNGLDNRRSNIRLATEQQNAANSRKCKKKTSSKFKGVTWHKRDKRWQAMIDTGERKSKWLGYFADEKDAARAYDAAALSLHGDFAGLNFSPRDSASPST